MSAQPAEAPADRACLAFQEAATSGDLTALTDLLDPAVVLRSPVVTKPYDGREQVMGLLSVLATVFVDFNYVSPPLVHRGEGDYRAALLFEAKADGAQVHGIDVLTVRDGLITEIAVYARPMPAVLALAKAAGRAMAASDPS